MAIRVDLGQWAIVLGGLALTACGSSGNGSPQGGGDASMDGTTESGSTYEAGRPDSTTEADVVLEAETVDGGADVDAGMMDVATEPNDSAPAEASSVDAVA